MAFPTSPTNGQTYKNYTYDSTSGSWKRTQAVYDSGSNANGSWIKYSDGTMICTYHYNRTQALTLTTFTNSSTIAYCGWIWTFPQAFSAAPTGISVTGDFNWGPGLEYHQAYNGSITSCNVEEGVLVSVTPTTLPCDTFMYAIGKWK